jgi:aspartyl aminopeptidase
MDASSFNASLLDFLNHSPTPFHAVVTAKNLLEKAGFRELKESETWNLQPQSLYYVVKQDSSLIAFTTGSADFAKSGFRMVGSHTDSPCLKLRPRHEIPDRFYLRLGVEIYGGVLLSTWFDRDLSIAGKVFFSDAKGELGSCLVDFKKPIALLPNLAIHLNRSANENRSIQKQTEIVPILGLETGDRKSFEKALKTEIEGTGAQSILGYELSLYDTQPATLAGLHNEFLVGARLDNLLSVYCSLRAILDCDRKNSCVVVCSDHEEVGSASAVGAQGPFLKSVLERITGNSETLSRAISNSVLVSTDNAHGVHPNYPEKHDGGHQPVLNHGPAIKTNANQHYATNGETAALFTLWAGEAKVPTQHFVARNDMACGSTIGPITATVLGVRTVDVGIPTFAMHSIRETAGTLDAAFLTRALVAFLNRGSV